MEEGIVFTISKIGDALGYMEQPGPHAYKIRFHAEEIDAAAFTYQMKVGL